MICLFELPPHVRLKQLVILCMIAGRDFQKIVLVEPEIIVAFGFTYPFSSCFSIVVVFIILSSLNAMLLHYIDKIKALSFGNASFRFRFIFATPSFHESD